MKLTDTHAHIYLPEFAETRKEMLERAEKEGVSNILLPAIDSESHAALLELARQYPGQCRPMMGLHPCYVKEHFREELKIARAYLEKGGFVAVGEIGLDFYWDKTFTEQQYLAFEEQIHWALEFDLPIAIHSRNSTDECIEVVRRNQNGKLKGVFHCFSGNTVQAQQIMDLGFYLGIGGVVTFKNGGLDKVFDTISLDKVVLETDAPYLAPVPFRGKQNEPSYLKYVVEKLAGLKNISIEEVAEITERNVRELFSKLAAKS
ncbi:MAG TPA: TatD family hydrolase [Chitinophagaceae bacterium]|nr:TatD family hydrolase [Chitinophagaceae bacterium]HPH30894.1 TatD family hydrolase [Chitinophagaceae bacterium]HPN58812.1 TatD family hydrolase [Chitinophagaceae bacterium]